MACKTSSRAALNQDAGWKLGWKNYIIWAAGIHEIVRVQESHATYVDQQLKLGTGTRDRNGRKLQTVDAAAEPEADRGGQVVRRLPKVRIQYNVPWKLQAEADGDDLLTWTWLNLLFRKISTVLGAFGKFQEGRAVKMDPLMLEKLTVAVAGFGTFGVFRGRDGRRHQTVGRGRKPGFGEA